MTKLKVLNILHESRSVDAGQPFQMRMGLLFEVLPRIGLGEMFSKGLNYCTQLGWVKCFLMY